MPSIHRENVASAAIFRRFRRSQRLCGRLSSQDVAIRQGLSGKPCTQPVLTYDLLYFLAAVDEGVDGNVVNVLAAGAEVFFDARGAKPTAVLFSHGCIIGNASHATC